MKTKIGIFGFLLAIVLVFSITIAACTDDPDTNEPAEVDLSWTETGQNSTISVELEDGSSASYSIEIVENLNGDSEAIIVDPEDGDTTIIEFRATEIGIYDYVLSNGDKSKPSTLVEWNAEVGTVWEYTVNSGTVVKRELFQKGNLYKVLQTYPYSPYTINVEGIEWELSPSSGIRACTIMYKDDDPVRISLN